MNRMTAANIEAPAAAAGLPTPGRRVSSIALVAVALAGLGCAGAGKKRLPMQESRALEQRDWDLGPARAGAVEGAWWRDLDPRLDALVTEALSSNRDLRAAAARLSAAAAQARIAGADLKPAVSTSLDGRRSRQNFVGLPVPGGQGVLSTTSSSLGVSLDASWEADLWGRIRAGRRAALGDLAGSRAELDGARLSLAGQVAKAWFALQETEAQLRLARDSVESFRDTAESVRRRYERGTRSPLDLRLALSAVAGAEGQLAEREARRELLVRQLEVLLGRLPDATLEAGESMPEVPREIPVGLPVDLLDRRPDLRMARARVEAAEAREQQARRALYPSLRLTTSGGTASNELSDLLDGDFRVWSLVGGIVSPLFQGGRLRAGVDLSGADADAALASFASTLLTALAEVEGGLASERALERVELSATSAREQAAAALELARREYGAGLVDFGTLLEAQRRELAAAGDQLGARRRRLEARVDLHLALGGGFEVETPAPAGGGPAGGESGR